MMMTIKRKWSLESKKKVGRRQKDVYIGVVSEDLCITAIELLIFLLWSYGNCCNTSSYLTKTFKIRKSQGVSTHTTLFLFVD